MAEYPTSTRAIVTTPPKDGAPTWAMQDISLRDPSPNEVLVRIVASGVCHTDLAISMVPPEYGMLFPKVMGHEGGGVVEKIGAGITHVKPGDLVLLSFDFCGADDCYNCAGEKPGFCSRFNALNLMSEAGVYKNGAGEAVAGSFFGQSSFANFALVKERSALNVTGLVRSEDELKLFVPFGCGFQTGAGAVTETARVGDKDSIAVFGLGGVGMLAVIAAKIRNAKTIVAVDKVQSRLDIAKSVGATHTINTSNFADLKADLDKAIKEIVPQGTNFNIDTTGVLPIIEAGVTSLQGGGQLILIGIMNGLTLNVDLSDLLANGKTIRGCIEGNAKPAKFVPQLIQWYHEGKLPIEKLIKFYPADDFEKALGDVHAGTTIKPILTW
ncbi:NAD(P)-binding protein [Melanomma pulvis-pyrius CBS 109.77]|uniref:NAD(P)-binding protein n=1 Tax=Melanomma pulvis-pyrius CBS 109.77 TaxID=1314802 RepID=A0A6A6XGA8_9PLEO|nr:NAD(P)-binding protein [Melanomma pulvis-pyrius CBS 109.77]